MSSLSSHEAIVLTGAESLADDELAARLAELVDYFANDDDDETDPQDLRELGAVAFVTARRMEAQANNPKGDQ